MGVHPLVIGDLPQAAYATTAPHIARQELIVQAALSGDQSFARVALSSDPLIRDPATVSPMFEELIAANAVSKAEGDKRLAAMDSPLSKQTWSR